ncbi:MAG: hypothetical protein IJZ57_04095 [Clostridia bacterium]|nr:hypothetical protein [Clostridia bacterium]
MFGYVRAYKPEMTFSQYDIYKGIYCSLCKAIGKNYGLIARLTLSYDFAFFALVRMSVEEACSGFKKSRCSFNPAKKCLECNLDDRDLEYTADVSMLMVYYKFLDNLQDSRGVKKLFFKLLSPYFNHIGKKGRKRNSEADDILNKMHLSQIDAEKNFNGNIDEVCHPSADALGKLLALNKVSQQEVLYKFGYMIGRWVYLVDALDDYENDEKDNSFNPFVLKENYTLDNAVASLNLTASEAVSAFEKLKIYKHKNIILNILYDGLHSSVKAVVERKGYEKSL